MKNLFRTFVIAVSSIVIVSCQKTDINDISDVSGKWIVVKEVCYYYDPNTKKWTFDGENDSEQGAYYIFNSDGSGKYYNSYSLPDGWDCNWIYSDGYYTNVPMQTIQITMLIIIIGKLLNAHQKNLS